MRRRRVQGRLAPLTAADRAKRTARNERRGRAAVSAKRRAWQPARARERITPTEARKRLRAVLRRIYGTSS